MLAETAISLTGKLDVRQTCDAILDAVERVFSARTSWILLYERASQELVTCAVRGPSADAYADARIPVHRGIVGAAFSRQEVLFVTDAQQETRWFDPERVRATVHGSVLTIPLTYERQGIGVLGLESPRFTATAPPARQDLRRLSALGALAGVGIRNARLFETVEAEKTRLERLLRERRELRGAVEHLRSEIRDARADSSIIGDSRQVRHVLAQVDLVAPADSTVLLIGETGTGKELFARAIHDRSRRASAPFIAVNCAALPDSLIESELFGYEKGAFTGAATRKPGKFELANRGTLFLDEIGDMPLPAQAKLLRVVQEREVQRLGGTTAIPVNVRIVAATNQHLATAMREGRFRPDLYYRLSVFPLALPPLRERRGDIPALVAHFARVFSTRQHVKPPVFTDDALTSLMNYDWPGNVRELQNVVERAVLLARGAEVVPASLSFPSPAPLATDSPLPPGDGWATPPADPVPSSDDGLVSLHDAERHAILNALRVSGWRVSGSEGAARILGLKPTTLHAKMKKLGIRRPSPPQAFATS